MAKVTEFLEIYRQTLRLIKRKTLLDQVAQGLQEDATKRHAEVKLPYNC